MYSESNEKQHYTLKRIDDLGRIQIPRYIREILNIKDGDDFLLTYDLNSRTITFTPKKLKGD